MFWPCNVRWQRARQSCKLFLTVGVGGQQGERLASPKRQTVDGVAIRGPASIARKKSSLSVPQASTLKLEVYGPSADCIMCPTAMPGQMTRGLSVGYRAFSRLIVICFGASLSLFLVLFTHTLCSFLSSSKCKITATPVCCSDAVLERFLKHSKCK